MLKMLSFEILILTLFANCALDLARAQDDIKAPKSFTVEGKVSMLGVFGTDWDRQEYSFQETVDYDSGSKVSIGGLGEQQMTYFETEETSFRMLAVDDNLVCKYNVHNRLVPELWFIEGLMSEFIDDVIFKYHLAGPAGFLGALLDHNSDQNKFISRRVMHRKVASLVRTIEKKKLSDNVMIRIDMILPEAREKFVNNLEEYDTVKISLLEDPTSQIARALNFTIDFYNFKPANSHENLMQLTETIGCSQFLELKYPKSIYKSFKMNYKTTFELDKLIQYDQDSYYMRDESRIWDLKEGYLFVPGDDSSECSAILVTSDTLSPAYKPFLSLNEHMTVNNFMGLHDLAYLGHTDRSLVFEGISEAPYFFGLTDSELKLNGSNPFRFIVKYMLEPDDKQNWTHEITAKPLKIQHISLYKQYTKNQTVKLMDEIDVDTFVWTEADESFMTPQCLNDITGMQRLELIIKFDGIHPKPRNQSYSDAFAANLAGLKSYLVKTILEVLDIRRFHLIEQEVYSEPNHIGIDLLIADRSNALALTYIGQALPPDQKDAVSWPIDDERQCVTQASTLDNIKFVFHCPILAGDEKRAKPACIVVSDTSGSGFVDSKDPNACTVHQFTPVDGPHKSSADWSPDKLMGIVFNYSAIYTDPAADMQRVLYLAGVVVNYEIQQQTQRLMTIRDFHYNLDQGSANVRSFDAISYQSSEDCSRMCNLDSKCKSYSYCPVGGKFDKASCLVSSLDIRAADVEHQLIDMSSTEVEVHDEKQVNGASYKLSQDSSCSLIERDYLGAFRLTKEFAKLPQAIVPSIATEPNVERCAQRSIELEMSKENISDHMFQVPWFAYCSSTQSCVLHESAFTDKLSPDDKDTGPLCRIHKKRYQTYFDVSSEVLKVDDTTKDQQHELVVESVEDCARACWPTKANGTVDGVSCISFDFCGSKSCLINKIGLNSSNFVGVSRKDCLHYERSKLLLSYLDMYTDDDDTSGGSLVWHLIYGLCLATLGVVSVLVGLSYGIRVHAKLRMLKLKRDNAAAASDYAHFQDDDDNDEETNNSNSNNNHMDRAEPQTEGQQQVPNILRMGAMRNWQ